MSGDVLANRRSGSVSNINKSGYQAGSGRGGERRTHDSDRHAFEVYQAFMAGYVRRINEATLDVTIGGIKIGSAKYSRLAQINLRSRIITFSRFAIENVPERGRRYLVIHELAHVKEPTHNKRFWEIVGRFEPDYKRIGRELDRAFQDNVRRAQLGWSAPGKPTLFTAPQDTRDERPGEVGQIKLVITPNNELTLSGSRLCTDTYLDDDDDSGIIYGGSEFDLPAAPAF